MLLLLLLLLCHFSCAQMVNTEIRLIIFFAAKDGEALHSQEKKNTNKLGADCGSDQELLLLPNSDLN